MHTVITLLAALLSMMPMLSMPLLAQGGTVSITILYDNYAFQDLLETDWGFAALIETPDQKLLFDTGTDGGMFMRNLSAMGKNPEEIDALVFSHDHGDHTGGLEALFDTGVKPPTYLLGAFDAGLRNAVAALTDAIEVEPGDEVLDGIFTTGQVGEAIPEQALVIPTSDGLVVITGCAHPGVVAMLERVRELSQIQIHLVIGGFHLFRSSAEQISATVQAVRDLGVERVGATHCTGDAAIEAFREEFGEEFVSLGVGRVLTFEATL